jgi:predicted N-acetyltransferase YhbS
VRRRRLRRDDVPLLWAIDRREVVEAIYELRDGQLVRRPAYFDITGWPPGEPEHASIWLEAAFDRGATFLGVFDGDRIVAAAVVDTKRIGPARDLVQLAFLHVGRDQRGMGLGTSLVEEAQRIATAAGAVGLYVSATPSEHTIDFYLRRGCGVIAEPDPELFAREPEDIHLECRVGARPED